MPFVTLQPPGLWAWGIDWPPQTRHKPPNSTLRLPADETDVQLPHRNARHGLTHDTCSACTAAKRLHGAPLRAHDVRLHQNRWSDPQMPPSADTRRPLRPLRNMP